MAGRWNASRTRGRRDERDATFDHRVSSGASGPDGDDGPPRRPAAARVPSRPGALPPALRGRELGRRSSDATPPAETGALSPAAEAAVPAPAAVSRHPDAGVAELVTAALSKVTHHSVVVLDRDLRYRAVAGAAHANPDYGASTLMDRTAQEALPAATWALHGPHLNAALRGESRAITVPSQAADVTVEVTFSPVVADGEILGVVAVTRELAEQSRSSSAPSGDLALAFGLTFDHSPICQALLSPDGRWVRVNRAFCELLGTGEAEIVGRGFHHVTDPRDHGVEEEWLQRLRDGRMDHYALPSRLVHADGSIVRVHVRLSAARLPSGELQGFVAQVIDLH